MRTFFNLVLLPLLVEILANVISEWLIRLADKDAIKKNKYRYDKVDIKHISNFDIDRYIVIDVETKNQVLKILLQIICFFVLYSVVLCYYCIIK